MTRVEICVDDVGGAAAAAAGGADRLELCAGLADGGTTPSIGFVEAALSEAPALAHRALIRPRSGDFVYSAEEVAVMTTDIDALRERFPDLGFVIGALTPERRIDVPVLRGLLAACGGAPVTFHRAFDAVADPVRAVDELVDLGLSTVLTGGGQGAAVDNLARLGATVARAGDRIEVMAGGGVRPANVARVVAATGVTSVHLRAPATVPSAGGGGNDYDPGTRTVTSAALVRELVTTLGEAR